MPRIIEKRSSEPDPFSDRLGVSLTVNYRGRVIQNGVNEFRKDMQGLSPVTFTSRSFDSTALPPVHTNISILEARIEETSLSDLRGRIEQIKSAAPEERSHPVVSAFTRPFTEGPSAIDYMASNSHALGLLRLTAATVEGSASATAQAVFETGKKVCRLHPTLEQSCRGTQKVMNAIGEDMEKLKAHIIDVAADATGVGSLIPLRWLQRWLQQL